MLTCAPAALDPRNAMHYTGSLVGGWGAEETQPQQSSEHRKGVSEMAEIEKRILNRLKRLLLKRVALHRLVLFGSRARGDSDPDSDMDILVVVEGTAGEDIRDYISDCAWEAGYREGILVVPVVFTRDEWENGPERSSLLAQAVAAEGVPL